MYIEVQIYIYMYYTHVEQDLISERKQTKTTNTKKNQLNACQSSLETKKSLKQNGRTVKLIVPESTDSNSVQEHLTVCTIYKLQKLILSL